MVYITRRKLDRLVATEVHLERSLMTVCAKHVKIVKPGDPMPPPVNDESAQRIHDLSRRLAVVREFWKQEVRAVD